MDRSKVNPRVTDLPRVHVNRLLLVLTLAGSLKLCAQLVFVFFNLKFDFYLDDNKENKDLAALLKEP